MARSTKNQKLSPFGDVLQPVGFYDPIFAVIVREISCARWATAPELRFSASRVKKRPPPLSWVDQSKLWPAQLGGGGLLLMLDTENRG